MFASLKAYHWWLVVRDDLLRRQVSCLVKVVKIVVNSNSHLSVINMMQIMWLWCSPTTLIWNPLKRMTTNCFSYETYLFSFLFCFRRYNSSPTGVRWVLWPASCVTELILKFSKTDNVITKFAAESTVYNLKKQLCTILHSKAVTFFFFIEVTQ